MQGVIGIRTFQIRERQVSIKAMTTTTANQRTITPQSVNNRADSCGFHGGALLAWCNIHQPSISTEDLQSTRDNRILQLSSALYMMGQIWKDSWCHIVIQRADTLSQEPHSTVVATGFLSPKRNQRWDKGDGHRKSQEFRWTLHMSKDLQSRRRPCTSFGSTLTATRVSEWLLNPYKVKLQLADTLPQRKYI